jgi:curved DNA-binding protein CbpA
VATYALFQPDELNLLRRRIEEAYRVLSDPERRQRYDSEMADFQNQTLSSPPPARDPAPETPAEPEVPSPAEEAVEASPPSEPTRPEAEPKPPVEEEPPAKEPQEAEPPGPPPPPLPVITEDTEYTGELLRQVREARQISLDQIADVTKIAIYYLRNLENENFTDLPAPVYVRGYLRQIAQLLGLDPAEASAKYLERMAKLKE